MNIFGFSLKKPDLISEVFFVQESSEHPNDSTTLTFLNNINADSLIAGDNHFSNDNSKKFIFNYSKDSTILFPKLFKALEKAEKSKGKARIAFLGDSMIEADLITMTLRYYLQKNFGGSGIGYIPATSITAQYRKSVTQKFGGWNKISLIEKSGDNMGFAGEVFQPAVQSKNYIKDASKVSNLSWVFFSPNAQGTQYMQSIPMLRAYYGKAQYTSENYITLEEKPGKIYPMNSGNIVNEIVLNDSSDSPLSTAKVYMHISSPVDVYGFNIDSPTGVFVDNYSLRGNSGIPLISLNSEILKGLNSHFNYNLIVLQYGLNVADAEMKDLSWYKAKIINVINYFKGLFPESDIMVMSVSDKCYKKNGRYTTEPAILQIVNAQHEAAKETGVIFFNLFEAMGGRNSMVKWVDSKPPLANKDYTHFNYEGAELIGKYIYGRIISEYKSYRQTTQK